jgi:hypothetical protein
LPTPRIRVYFASRRLVVDYFTYAARPGTSARRAARHAARLRLRRASGFLGTSHDSSRSSSRGSSSTNSTMPRVRVPQHVVRLVAPFVVNFDYAARLGASARRAACLAARRRLLTYAARPGASTRRTARHTARHRLLRASRLRFAATLTLLHPRRASQLLISRQHRLYFLYNAHHCGIIFRSHRVDRPLILISFPN